MEILFTPTSSGFGAAHSPVDRTGAGGSDEPSDSYTVENLLAIVQQQQSAITAFLGSVGQSSGFGASSPLGAFQSGGLPDFSDPTGAAIDYLLGSTGSGGGAGNVFTLALSAQGLGTEFVQLARPHPAQAEQAYQDSSALLIAIEDAKQSALNTLLQLRSGNGSQVTSLF